MVEDEIKLQQLQDQARGYSTQLASARQRLSNSRNKQSTASYRGEVQSLGAALTSVNSQIAVLQAKISQDQEQKNKLIADYEKQIEALQNWIDIYDSADPQGAYNQNAHAQGIGTRNQKASEINSLNKAIAELKGSTPPPEVQPAEFIPESTRIVKVRITYDDNTQQIGDMLFSDYQKLLSIEGAVKTIEIIDELTPDQPRLTPEGEEIIADPYAGGYDPDTGLGLPFTRPQKGVKIYSLPQYENLPHEIKIQIDEVLKFGEII